MPNHVPRCNSSELENDDSFVVDLYANLVIDGLLGSRLNAADMIAPRRCAMPSRHYLLSDLSTVVTLGAHFHSSSLSFSDGSYPSFFSAWSERWRPTTLQAMRPIPTPARVFGDRFLYALRRG
ncbi:hypothetical protein J3458_002068 [Metarhizium acridum]|uniref:uncharacterized protein n=1 Tax=Metarhizium acridum TaxID=92637 RepID=UPI001C6B3CDC|nr:hypothetical protein J3458_002068 [Metarhizium acridum]